jgi:hypothetical protein
MSLSFGALLRWFVPLGMLLCTREFYRALPTLFSKRENMARSYAQRKLQTTAYHEAGHAVVACLMGIPFQRVTVAPGPVPVDQLRRTTLGQVEFDLEWPKWARLFHPTFDRKRTRQYAARNVCMTVAGPLAESLHLRCWTQPPGDKGDDEFMAFEVAAACDVARTPKGTRNWINRLRFQTLETLRTPEVWAAVETVAQELATRKVLRGPEVHSLVNRALPCGVKGHGTRPRPVD